MSVSSNKAGLLSELPAFPIDLLLGALGTACELTDTCTLAGGHRERSGDQAGDAGNDDVRRLDADAAATPTIKLERPNHAVIGAEACARSQPIGAVRCGLQGGMFTLPHGAYRYSGSCTVTDAGWRTARL